jgi:hypothetical protein
MLLLDDQGHQVRLSAGLKVKHPPAWTADSINGDVRNRSYF